MTETTAWIANRIECSPICPGDMVLRRNSLTGEYFLACTRCRKTRSITREDIGRLTRSGISKEQHLVLAQQLCARLEQRLAEIQPKVDKAQVEGRFAHNQAQKHTHYHRASNWAYFTYPDPAAQGLKNAWLSLRNELALAKMDLEWLEADPLPADDIPF